MKLKNLLKTIISFSLVATMGVALSGCASNNTKKFTIAYLPNESIPQKADARTGLAKQLSKELNMEVVEFQASDYSAIIEAMKNKKVDMAYFGPLSFCLANEKANAKPVAMKAENGDKNSATYKSVLIVKQDSPIKTIKDIKGKTMAFVEPTSTSGNMIPSAEIIKSFPELNLNMDTLHTNGEFFKSVSFSGKHQAGLQAVLKGDIDVAPISDQILASEIKNGNAPKDGVRVIYESTPIPSEPMAIRGDLDQALQDKISNFLINYSDENYFETLFGNRSIRFIPAKLEDYKDIIELNKELNK